MIFSCRSLLSRESIALVNGVISLTKFGSESSKSEILIKDGLCWLTIFLTTKGDASLNCAVGMFDHLLDAFLRWDKMSLCSFFVAPNNRQ